MLYQWSNMWYNYIVEWMFRKRFGAYEHQFVKADVKIMKMKDAEKKEYYRRAKDIVENETYAAEVQELIRKYYAELACTTNGELEQQSYRLTLKAIQDLDGRLKALASLYSPPTVSRISEQL